MDAITDIEQAIKVVSDRIAGGDNSAATIQELNRLVRIQEARDVRALCSALLTKAWAQKGGST